MGVETECAFSNKISEKWMHMLEVDLGDWPRGRGGFPIRRRRRWFVLNVVFDCFVV